MQILKLDLQLNPIWQREFDNQGGGMPNQKLFYYQNSIIALLSSFRLDDKDADIVALDDATGEILWQQHLPYLIEFFHLAGDRLYLSSQLHGYWCVLCAKTGDVLLQQQVEGSEDDIIRCRYLWPFDEYLLLHNGFDRLTVIDQASGEHLADIDMPPEFSLSHVPPKVVDDYVYVMLGAGGEGMQFSYAGVMVLSRERLRQGPPYTVDVEPYLGVSHSVVTDGDTDYYDIQISCAELGDVLRFGQIEMRKVAQRHSYNFFGNMDKNVKQRVNKRFDGRLQLSIDRAALNNPDDSKIDLLVQLYNQHYQNGFIAPATRKPLSVSWRYV
ncbi:hypothetical protein GCM10011297_28990 [Bacterioplanes sanyensis]|uniref:hypothetical protein n=1 Tax=Bacterioplanes sanyensis TaxID=1249553 RepID=UPI001675E311|nr:hypothetical protein [Bacterioplanes sanyensis]GGY54301.1 hypothetical protein GCM10011297_28990 [Bacterioplanes sanyensis]